MKNSKLTFMKVSGNIFLRKHLIIVTTFCQAALMSSMAFSLLLKYWAALSGFRRVSNLWDGASPVERREFLIACCKGMKLNHYPYHVLRLEYPSFAFHMLFGTCCCQHTSPQSSYLIFVALYPALSNFRSLCLGQTEIET